MLRDCRMDDLMADFLDLDDVFGELEVEEVDLRDERFFLDDLGFLEEEESVCVDEEGGRMLVVASRPMVVGAVATVCTAEMWLAASLCPDARSMPCAVRRERRLD